MINYEFSLEERVIILKKFLDNKTDLLLDEEDQFYYLKFRKFENLRN